MINKENWVQTQAKFTEFWALENHDRPLIELWGINENYKQKKFTPPKTIKDRWLDAEYTEKTQRDQMQSRYYAFEAFPTFMVNLGPDILGAILGDDIEFAEETSYSKHLMQGEDYASYDFTLNKNNYWYKTLMDMTSYIAKQAKGEYMVGLSDFHPGCDALVSLRGPQNLCLDLSDYENEVKKATFEIFNTFKEVLTDSYNLLSKYQQGSTTWMHLWHKRLWYVTSCDFCGLISPQMFDDFVEEELRMEIDFLEESIFHLDGPLAINLHLNKILTYEKLKGVQLTYGAGAGSSADWILECKKIQAAGKALHLSVAPKDIPVLLEHLKPEGFFMDVSREPYSYNSKPFSAEEAKEIEKTIENCYKKRLF